MAIAVDMGRKATKKTKKLFSVFHVFQALSIFVLVNDLYIGDPLEAN